MPDQTVILGAMAAAALIAALMSAGFVLILGWRRRSPSAAPVPSYPDALPDPKQSVGWWRRPAHPWASAGGVLGVGLGFYAGVWLLGLRPHWPPREDLDRLVFILFPAIIAIELLGAFAGRLRWLVWLPRLGTAAVAARILLHGSVYLTDSAGTGTPEWSPAQTWLILGGLAAALAAVWTLLALLMWRAPGPSVPLALAIPCAGAAVTVMLSSYASGGQAGFALAAALAGAALASLALARPPDLRGVLGIGVVGVFALLVMGRFFATLSTTNAALLFFAPLLCWLPELPYYRNVWPWLRGLVRLALVAVPVIVVLFLAQQKFDKDSGKSSPGSIEPSRDDYLNYK
jgi:hypothetical protein